MDNDRRQPQQSSRRLVRELRSLAAVETPEGLLPAVLSELGLADAFFAIESQLGPLLIAYNDLGIAAVGRGADRETFVAGHTARCGRPLRSTPTPPAALSQAVARRLRGERADLRFDLRGLSEFERATLLKATEIPRGEIRPYAWIAREIGRPGAVRAVGSALGRNPIPLLIPCHRVVRSDGLIGDYVFGNAMKRAVLSTEGLVPEEIERRARARTRYHASDTTGIYCFPTCHNARRITDPHLITFASDAAARTAGYRPCKICRPAIAS